MKCIDGFVPLQLHLQSKLNRFRFIHRPIGDSPGINRVPQWWATYWYRLLFRKSPAARALDTPVSGVSDLSTGCAMRCRPSI